MKNKKFMLFSAALATLREKWGFPAYGRYFQVFAAQHVAPV
jgi:hypothetical protein